jgi:8-oxo-dGTP diphosphatase
MYVHCSCGQRHWGAYGAAGLLLTDPDATGVVLQKRSLMTHHGGTWALIGGAIEPGETPADAALREAYEEEGLDPATVRVVRTFTGTDHPDWTYSYVVTETERPDDPVLVASGGWESDGARWVDLDDVPGLALHPSLRDDWPRLRVELAG